MHSATSGVLSKEPKVDAIAHLFSVFALASRSLLGPRQMDWEKYRWCGLPPFWVFAEGFTHPVQLRCSSSWFNWFSIVAIFLALTCFAFSPIYSVEGWLLVYMVKTTVCATLLLKLPFQTISQQLHGHLPRKHQPTVQCSWSGVM